MKPQYHVAASAMTAGILYLMFKSWGMALSCFISGILIDLDHVYDLVKVTGRNVSFGEFLRLAFNNDITRWTMILHSWELLLVLFMLAWYTNWNPWISGVLAGFGHHIIIDALYQGVTIRNYSFLYRKKINFIVKQA